MKLMVDNENHSNIGQSLKGARHELMERRSHDISQDRLSYDNLDQNAHQGNIKDDAAGKFNKAVGSWTATRVSGSKG